jgi:hypothetical protein
MQKRYFTILIYGDKDKWWQRVLSEKLIKKNNKAGRIFKGTT